MPKKFLILLMMMLFVSPVHANEEVNVEITEAGIQKTPADDISLQNMVPGDQKTYTLQLKNNSSKVQRLYLKLSAEEEMLAEQLELQVSQKNRILYKGTIQELQIGIDLGSYVPQDKATIQMTWYLPEKADNPYTMQKSSVNIEISAQTIEAAINTGDHSKQILLIAVIMISGMFMIIMIDRRNNHEKRL